MLLRTVECGIVAGQGGVIVVTSTASTVQEYLDSLPPDRRAVVAAVREVVLRHLPAGYQETMNWGMISYELPLSVYPRTHNGKPLSYAALAAQKHHYALYLMAVYADPGLEARLREGFTAAGKKLDVGKSCVRFHRLEDLAMDLIGDLVAGTPPDAFIALYERSRRRP
jgi:hypothetical protein